MLFIVGSAIRYVRYMRDVIENPDVKKEFGNRLIRPLYTRQPLLKQLYVATV